MTAFRFRLEQVLDHRERREDLVKQELARAMAAVAAQQERAVAAEEAVERAVLALRVLMAGGSAELAELRQGHEGLALLRGRAAYERATVDSLAAVADERRADVVRASQDREALSQLRASALERHRVEGLRREGAELDELALRRATRRSGASA